MIIRVAETNTEDETWTDEIEEFELQTLLKKKNEMIGSEVI